jgi:ferredoxin--NADP+ reductase
VFRAVGYRGVPIAGVPFDARSGKIPNAGGRVLDEAGGAVPGQYVVGWAKRGPTGLIGTNRGDSAATVVAMVADLKAGRMATAGSPGESEALLRSREVAYVTFEHWKALDAHEVQQGAAAKKLREKVTRIDEMLRLVRGKPG